MQQLKTISLDLSFNPSIEKSQAGLLVVLLYNKYKNDSRRTFHASYQNSIHCEVNRIFVYFQNQSI